jgi:diadenosine tetraphosphatase ApaH/serine/threonine PP2A family protein phosphatase
MHLATPDGHTPAYTRSWNPVLLNQWQDMPVGRAIFNPGSVGQPRHHAALRGLGGDDNRASYMLLRRNGRQQFQFRRVAYDFEKTIARLRSIRWPDGEVEIEHDIYKSIEDAMLASKHKPHSPRQQDLYAVLACIEDGLREVIEKRLIPELK